MKKSDIVVTGLVIGIIAFNVPKAWTSELVGSFSGTPQGISAPETFMTNPGTDVMAARARSSAAVGRVTSIDKNQNQLTIEDEYTGEQKLFRAMNPEILETAAIGDRVRIHDRDFRQGPSTREQSAL